MKDETQEGAQPGLERAVTCVPSKYCPSAARTVTVGLRTAVNINGVDFRIAKLSNALLEALQYHD